MAMSSDPIFGAVKGKLNNLVIYQMYGKTIIRTRPAYKRKAATGKLKKSQDDFKVVMKTLRRVKVYLSFGFNEVASGRSAFHTALSQNLLRYREVEEKSPKEWLQVSAGNRAGALDWQLTQASEGEYMLLWGKEEPDKIFHATDQLMLVLLGREKLRLHQDLYTAKRSESQALIKVPSFMEADIYDCFVCFKSERLSTQKNPDLISNSFWVGEIDLKS